MTVAEQKPRTPADLVEATIKILQRGLPGRDLDDRAVVTEIWGLVDTDEARAIYQRPGRMP